MKNGLSPKVSLSDDLLFLVITTGWCLASNFWLDMHIYLTSFTSVWLLEIRLLLKFSLFRIGTGPFCSSSSSDASKFGWGITSSSSTTSSSVSKFASTGLNVEIIFWLVLRSFSSRRDPRQLIDFRSFFLSSVLPKPALFLLF